MAKRKSQEYALSRIKAVHGDTYDYSKFVYVKAQDKVTLVCKVHGDFTMRYSDLASGSGCWDCGNSRKNDKLRLPYSEFLNSAKKHHGDKYTYDESSYKGNNLDVRVFCPHHGEFMQRAGRHASGCGCPKCQINGFSRGRIGSLYLLSNGISIKIGVTNRKVHSRIKEINKTLPSLTPQFKLISHFTADGEFVYNAEQDILKKYSGYILGDLSFSGSTETFDNVVFDNIILDFISYKMISSPVGTISVTNKKKTTRTRKQVTDYRRAKVLTQTGVPVGVVVNQGKWAFQLTKRDENNVKYKKIYGKFIDKNDAIDFANHYYSTGEFKDTRVNLLQYNSNGYMYGVKLRNGKFEVCSGFTTVDDGVHHKKYLGTFSTLEEAESTLIKFKERVLSGEFGKVFEAKYT